MLALWTERTHVARAIVHETMSDHLVLALEASSTFGASAVNYWTVVWAAGAVHVLVGAIIVLVKATCYE